jgi:hypothetical protein
MAENILHSLISGMERHKLE